MALTVLTEETHPSDWAKATVNLAGVYLDDETLPERQRAQNAMACYAAALRVFDRESYPSEWASVHYELGKCCRPLGGQDGEMVSEGISHLREAAETYLNLGDRRAWAKAQYELGRLHELLADAKGRSRLRLALQFYREALTVFTLPESPLDWAAAHYRIGRSLVTALDTAGDGLWDAIRSFDACLQVYTRNTYPVEWANVQESLAMCYWAAPMRCKVAQYAAAAACFQAALSVYDEETFPRQYATVNVNLGALYAALPFWSRAGNLRRACEHLQKALATLARMHDPALHAGAHLNLGLALREAGHASRAIEELTEAARIFRTGGMEAAALDAEARCRSVVGT